MIGRALWLLFLLFSACHRPVEKPVDVLAVDAKRDFVPVPFLGYTPGAGAAVLVQIQDKPYVLLLDLGSETELELLDSVANRITDKQYLETSAYFNVKESRFDTDRYALGSVWFGGIKANNVHMNVIPQQNYLESLFYQPQDCELEDGLIGWQFFSSVSLMVDVPNDRVVLMRTLEALEPNGYPLETFTCVPLLLDRGFVQIEAEIDGKSMRCMLDTGCTLNFYPLARKGGKSLNEAVEDPEERKSHFLHLAGVDFGEMTMVDHIFSKPERIEAILGMQFFKEHQVVIDFPGEKVYIRKFAKD